MEEVLFNIIMGGIVVIAIVCIAFGDPAKLLDL